MPLLKLQTFKHRVQTIFEDIKELLNEPDTDENVANIRKILGEPKERPCQYLLAAGFYGRVGLLKILIDEIPVSLLQNIQLLTSDYKRLLNKPYENEVTLTWQNPPLKCC